MDKPNLIRQAIYDALVHESEGGFLDSFDVWQEMPRNQRILYPCAVIASLGADTVMEFLGGGAIRAVTVEIDVAVQEKKGTVEDEADVLEAERMIVWYAERFRDWVDALELNSEELNIGGIEFEYRPAASVIDDKALIYGLTAIVRVLYEDD